MKPSATTQAELFRFLANPATHGLSEPVVQIDTHGAAVFLAGKDAYKVKRAVRFPFMDFSTLEKRRKACEAELAINRPHAPDLYLGLTPITREANGRLALGGDGKIVEWAVHLRRFDERQTLDLIAERQRLPPQLIRKVADAVLEYHARAEVRTADRATAALHEVVEETLAELLGARNLFGSERTEKFTATLLRTFSDCRHLLGEREGRGCVRRCHGDLHLRNIALIDENPVIFDAIEFDDALATIDIFYDLAFLLMDLCERRLPDEANYSLNRYLWNGNDPSANLEGMALLPLFLSLRAAIRAKVAILPDAEGRRPPGCEIVARGYFDAAEAFLEPKPPSLLAIGGLSGAGKTTLATAIAAGIGRAPGAVILRSDVERKRQFGVAETRRLPSSAYGSDASAACYGALRSQAEIALRAGHSVIVDAVHARADERDALRGVARNADVKFRGIWLEAPAETLMRRVEDRVGDASDATPAVVAGQLGFDIGRLDWDRLDAVQDIETLKMLVLDRIATSP